MEDPLRPEPQGGHRVPEWPGTRDRSPRPTGYVRPRAGPSLASRVSWESDWDGERDQGWRVRGTHGSGKGDASWRAERGPVVGEEAGRLGEAHK